MNDTKVYLLDGGSLVIDGFHIYWNRGPGGEVRFPCYSVLVDHPEGKFVFDTGFDKKHVEAVLPFEKPMQTDEQTVPGALKLIGMEPGEITHVVNSHYHFDHCGGNHHLTNATTLCHAAELDAARKPEVFEGLGYSDQAFDVADDIYTPKYELLEGDVEIAKGVYLIETPGHTVGHYSMLVELNGRKPMLFTADACYTQQNMDMNCIASFHVDPVASHDSMDLLRKVAQEREADLFFSHDAESYKSYLKAPGYYS